MGKIIPFRRKQGPLLAPLEFELLDKLRGSLKATGRGNWAEPGERGGVVLVRNRHYLGIWTLEEGELLYRPIATGQILMRAREPDDAHDRTLALLGEQPG